VNGLVVTIDAVIADAGKASDDYREFQRRPLTERAAPLFQLCHVDGMYFLFGRIGIYPFLRKPVIGKLRLPFGVIDGLVPTGYTQRFPFLAAMLDQDLVPFEFLANGEVWHTAKPRTVHAQSVALLELDGVIGLRERQNVETCDMKWGAAHGAKEI
jgi:hypothetical protein